MNKLFSISASAIAASLLLAACGGGGGGGGNPTPSANANANLPYVVTLAYGENLKTVVGHALGNDSAFTSVTASLDGSTLQYGNSSSLSNYVLDNGYNTVSVSTSGMTAGGLVTLSANAGKQNVYVGGTTWSDSRYVLFYEKTPNSNGANTEYTLRNVPYVRYHKYKKAVISNATYNQPGGKAVGTFVVDSLQAVTVTCDASIALTTVAGAETAAIQFSGCNNGIAMSGSVTAAKTNTDALASASVAGLTLTSAQGTFTPSWGKVFYGLGGPNSEEFVGTLYLNGTTATSGGARNTQVTFAFGARK